MSLPPRIDAKAVRERIGPYADKAASIDERTAIYAELIGFVPPRIEARMAVTGALDPTLLDLQEKMRDHAMYPKCFDVKTAQLMLFGMLLMDMSDAAQLHAIAARRAFRLLVSRASRMSPVSTDGPPGQSSVPAFGGGSFGASSLRRRFAPRMISSGSGGPCGLSNLDGFRRVRSSIIGASS